MRYATLLLFVMGCGQVSSTQLVITPKKIGPAVAQAWEKHAPADSYFVVAYRLAPKEWATVERRHEDLVMERVRLKDGVPIGYDFADGSKRPYEDGKPTPGAKEDAQGIALKAAEWPEVSFVCIVDARPCKVTGTYVLKDKALAPAAMPKDVSEKLTVYLYYLQHAAAGYTRENLP